MSLRTIRYFLIPSDKESLDDMNSDRVNHELRP